MSFNQNDPALGRRYGSLLAAGAALAGAVFAVGLARRSYWAVALPVTVAVSTMVAGAIAVGRLLATTPDEPADPEP